jgi:hypothetical protein
VSSSVNRSTVSWEGRHFGQDHAEDAARTTTYRKEMADTPLQRVLTLSPEWSNKLVELTAAEKNAFGRNAHALTTTLAQNVCG